MVARSRRRGSSGSTSTAKLKVKGDQMESMIYWIIAIVLIVGIALTFLIMSMQSGNQPMSFFGQSSEQSSEEPPAPPSGSESLPFFGSSSGSSGEAPPAPPV